MVCLQQIMDYECSNTCRMLKNLKTSTPLSREAHANRQLVAAVRGLCIARLPGSPDLGGLLPFAAAECAVTHPQMFTSWWWARKRGRGATASFWFLLHRAPRGRGRTQETPTTLELQIGRLREWSAQRRHNVKPSRPSCALQWKRTCSEQPTPSTRARRETVFRAQKGWELQAHYPKCKAAKLKSLVSLRDLRPTVALVVSALSEAVTLMRDISSTSLASAEASPASPALRRELSASLVKMEAVAIADPSRAAEDRANVQGDRADCVAARCDLELAAGGIARNASCRRDIWEAVKDGPPLPSKPRLCSGILSRELQEKTFVQKRKEKTYQERRSNGKRRQRQPTRTPGP